MIYLLRKIIQLKLKYFAKIYLWRFSPVIIIIAGTTNRHWVKERILAILREDNISCQGNKKNFNAEIGLPLSILGLEPAKEDKIIFFRWLNVVFRALFIALGRKKITDYLVLEMAINQPDDMDYLLGFIKPQIAIFTTITMIYPENFSGLDEIAKEYRKLLEALPKKGLAILNADDQRILRLKAFAPCPVKTYGIESPNADYQAGEIRRKINGQAFKISLPDMSSEIIEIKRFGTHHIYAELVKEIILNKIKK